MPDIVRPAADRGEGDAGYRNHPAAMSVSISAAAPTRGSAAAPNTAGYGVTLSGAGYLLNHHGAQIIGSSTGVAITANDLIAEYSGYTTPPGGATLLQSAIVDQCRFPMPASTASAIRLCTASSIGSSLPADSAASRASQRSFRSHTLKPARTRTPMMASGRCRATGRT